MNRPENNYKSGPFERAAFGMRSGFDNLTIQPLHGKFRSGVTEIQPLIFQIGLHANAFRIQKQLVMSVLH